MVQQQVVQRLYLLLTAFVITVKGIAALLALANDSMLIADTNTYYTWHCVGSNGGTTATNCQKAKPAPVNGVCDNSQQKWLLCWHCK